MRGPRVQVAAKPTNVNFLRPTTGSLRNSITLTGPCTRGDESQRRAQAMGNYSARNYAVDAGVAGAENESWEWPHVLGSAIGGANVAGNLVASTYDDNTRMTMQEKWIVRYSQRSDVDTTNPMTVEAEADLWSNTGGYTYVATQIRLIARDKGAVISRGTFNIGERAAIDKMEYDFYETLFAEMAQQWDAEEAYDENEDADYEDSEQEDEDMEDID